MFIKLTLKLKINKLTKIEECLISQNTLIYYIFYIVNQKGHIDVTPPQQNKLQNILQHEWL